MQIKHLQMKRALCSVLLVLLLCVAGMTKANPVDMNTAREVAVKFINANTKVPLHNADELQLVTTYNISQGNAAFHIFNTPNGFVIVSADDCTTPILGYSDEGQFDMENIPIQLQDYLQGFVEQIEYGIEKHLEADAKTAHEWELVRRIGRLNENRDGEVVEPLITAMWGQSCYYNAMCPEDEAGPCGHCVTGCVATAMGMIMHYWGYPTQGQGFHTYTGYPQQSVNYGETTYDWSNMPNQLTDASTQAEIDAISTLLWHCGVAVNMVYGPGASGASSANVPYALVNYFGYSNDLSMIYREDYTDAEWLAMVKSSLDLGRPVYYSGLSVFEFGHAFVCDGYDVNDRFHFNWGWNGSANGYFALDATMTFIYNNDAIYNIHPNVVITRQVTAFVNPAEGGTVNGDGLYDINSICTLTATANEGYTFLYWTENNEVVSTQAEYSFWVRKDRELVAHFGTPFQIEVEVVPMEGGMVSGVGEYAYGSICTLTATANEGYDFICWRKANGSVVSTASTYAFTVTEATTLTAVFAVTGGDFIVFADPNVETICVTYWDTNNDGKLSYAEAAAVTSLAHVFYRNTAITSFEELQYFTGLETIDVEAFYGCIGLTGDLTIPNSVTTIGNFAFHGCSGFTGSLTIPNSVTTIGNWAFAGCSGFIGDLTIPNSVTSIGMCAFSYCSGFTGSLTIPNSMTTIGEYAFAGCCGFTGSLTIGNSVTEIGENAFDGCSGFTGSLTIPNSVTTIEREAFYNCSGFTGSLTIGSSVTSIGDRAFYGCGGFTGSLTIPNSMTTIGEYAFAGCCGFTGSLTIGNSVTTIGNCAFSYCTGFSGSLTIGNSVTSIGNSAFRGCHGLTGSLIIPNSVTSIGEVAFAGCSGFTGSLTIPNSVTSIANGTFYNCSGFTGDLNIPNSVTSIGASAFWGCSGFTGNLSIPNSVTSIGVGAFRGCSGFTGNLIIPNFVTTISAGAFYGCCGFTGNLVIPNSVISIEGDYYYGGAFFNCSGFTGNLTIPNSVTTIGRDAFYNCSGFTGSLTIGNSVTSIGYCAFYNCSGFTGLLTIPNSVIEINEGAFLGCSGFTGDLSIPNSVTLIGNGAFYNCSGFTGSLTLGNSLTSIGSGAFKGCSGFTGNLTIPNSVTIIGDHAFSNCRNLSSVIVLAETPPTVEGTNAFDFVYVSPVYVPCGFEEVYTTLSWGGFFNFMGLCAGEITAIANPAEGGSVTGAGYYEGGETCTLIATANDGYSFVDWIKDGVSVSNSDTCTFLVVGDAFYVANFSLTGDWNLPIQFADVNVKALCVANWDTNGDGELSYAEAARVTSLGEVFRNNSSIVSFDELQYFIGLTSIGNYAFYYCIGLTSIEIPNSVTSIGYDAFYNCTSLTSVDIPNSVTSIGSSAFSNCTNLTSVELPNSVTYMDSNPFSACSDLEQIIVDSGNMVYDSRDNCNAIIKTSTNELVTGCKNTIIPNTVTSIGSTAFYYCSGLTSIVIPNSVTSIGSQAFCRCSGLTSIMISNSVTSIGQQAFSHCGLTTIEIPNSVTSIGGNPFFGCNGLEQITVASDNAYYDSRGNCNAIINTSTNALVIGCKNTVIPNTVTSIGNEAFYYCSGLTSIVIPNSVTSIGGWAFCGCSSLSSVTVLAETPPDLGSYTFVHVDKTVPVHVPCGTLEVYQNALGWNEFNNIMELCPGTITVTASPAEGGMVTGGGYYEGGETCTLIATANDGYTFYNWTDSGTIVSNNPNYSFIVAGDRNLVANFVEGGLCAITFDLYDSFGDGWNGNKLVVTTDYGLTCEITLDNGSSGTQTLMLVNGHHVTLTWIVGSWMGECSFTISYSSGDIIYQGENLNGDFMYEFDVNCGGSTDITQTSTFSQGWNWWSTYIEQDGIDGLTMLEEGLGANGYQIKSQTDFVTNYGTMWMGMLLGINNEETYMIDNTADCQIELTGAPVSPTNHPITVNNGWNWIGYPCTNSMSVAEAFAGFEPTNGDQVKSQADYAMYFNGIWIGQLLNITPGTGLMYMSNSTTPTTLVYSEGGRNTAATASPKATHWTNNIHAYPNNMTVMAVVELNDEELHSENYELAAFANGECRGSVKLVYVEPLNRYVAFLTVSGKDATKLSYRLYDTETGTEYYDAEETLNFIANATVGDPNDVYVIHFRGTTGMDELANKVRIYPNPVNRGEHFSINIADEEKSPVRVEIVNALGMVIETVCTPSAQMITTPNAAGVYTLRITVEEEGTLVRKLVVK